jgi:hypothetical protein
MTSLRPFGLAGVVFTAVLGATACDPSDPKWGDDTSGTAGTVGDGDDDPNSDAWLKLGQGELEFDEIQDGDELLMVLGGQGLLMFPIPLHAGEFTLPDDPGNYLDPKVPVLDLHLDIEGFNIGFGGHFARIANYPIPFEVLDDGTYEFIYVTIFVPDELENPCDIDELPGQLHVELETADGETLIVDLDVSIEVPDFLGTGCMD